MLPKLENLHKEFCHSMNSVSTQADILNLKSEFLGKKGKISEILKGLKNATPEERKTLGQKSNEYKKDIEKQVAKALKSLEIREINEKLAKNWVDPTLKNSILDLGLRDAGYHPVTIIQREIEDIFLSMGFDILDGPHIEDEFHNFEALNIPADHPARDMQDTFWFQDMKHLLRITSLRSCNFFLAF